MVAVQHVYDDDDRDAPPLAVATARAHVEWLAAGLPESLLATRPEDVRRAARRCFEADAAAARRRARVGERPEFDDDAAAKADGARAAVEVARDDVVTASDQAVRLVTLGNAWGITGVAGAAILLTVGVEPMAASFGALVLGAAAGPCASSVIAIARREGARSRLARAIDHWSVSLGAVGVSTRGELEARRIAVAAWTSRDVEAKVAEDEAERARVDWQAIAGDGVPPHQGPALAARLVALRGAQLQLLRSLLHEATATPLPLPGVDGEADANDDDSWLGDALSRLRGRGMRLWSGR